MKFRTEIEPLHGSFAIGHDDAGPIVMLGSCFADEVGERLARDGFSVVHNPLGPLFNPLSIARVLARGPRPYSPDEFTFDGTRWHCLDFANRYQAESPEVLADMVNTDYLPLARAIEQASTLIITFGNTKVYEHIGGVAGNCHKLPATFFYERYIGIDEIVDTWLPLLDGRKRVILTLSPVRYIGDGLAQSFLAKAVLRVAIDRLRFACQCDYFPSFEILNDDLRDYRFYAPDMKHPSPQAVDYIYDRFAEAYFSEDTRRRADSCRRQWLRSNHKPLL